MSNTNERSDDPDRMLARRLTALQRLAELDEETLDRMGGRRTKEADNMSNTNERPVASTGSVAGDSDPDLDRMLAARLHGIADHSMSIVIGNMIQEMITDRKMRASPEHPGNIPFTLTDAEREAVEWAAAEADEYDEDESQAHERAAVLRGLLARHIAT